MTIFVLKSCYALIPKLNDIKNVIDKIWLILNLCGTIASLSRCENFSVVDSVRELGKLGSNVAGEGVDFSVAAPRCYSFWGKEIRGTFFDFNYDAYSIVFFLAYVSVRLEVEI